MSCKLGRPGAATQLTLAAGLPQAFARAEAMQKVALEALAFSLPAGTLDELRTLFNAIDADHSGTISCTARPEPLHAAALASHRCTVGCRYRYAVYHLPRNVVTGTTSSSAR